MKNLENYGVTGLGNETVNKINGGVVPWYVIVAAAITIASAADHYLEEYGKGWNNPR